MRRTATVLSGSACCVYGLTFTSHFYGARRTVGYVPFSSETLVTGKLFGYFASRSVSHRHRVQPEMIIETKIKQGTVHVEHQGLAVSEHLGSDCAHRFLTGLFYTARPDRTEDLTYGLACNDRSGCRPRTTRG